MLRFQPLLALALAGCSTVHAQPVAAPTADRASTWVTPADRVPFDAFGGLDLDPAVPSPEDHLGYAIGTHFTRQGDMLAYLETLAAASDRVQLEHYGTSHQRRPLVLLTVSDPANLADLDGVLARNLALADPDTPDAQVESILERSPAVVWFSYNVHGNEPSPTETAIQLAYTLAAARNPEARALLRDLVVVIDPLLNPDGRERYVSWYQNTLGKQPLPDRHAAEHDEPWPGGRTNHYYFDLNRDWLWLTQPESQHRLSAYRRYLPQLHIDFHEQHYNQPYFLGAGEEPYHPHIPEASKAWVERYGRANAASFDAHGLLYSTAERFDYLYPGYGKVMPIYYGAVGMLAEQAGHGRAGLAIEVDDTYTLTLQERADHHFLLSVSNMQYTAEHRREQLERFRAFYDPAPFLEDEPTQAYAIDPGNDPTLLAAVRDLCFAHGIRIQTLDEPTVVDGLIDYRDGETLDGRELAAGTWVIPVDQPMGRLAATLFERDPGHFEGDTYDITSWPVPVAFGLDAWLSAEPIEAATTALDGWTPPAAAITGDGNVAVLVDAGQHLFPVAIGLAERHAINARIAGDAIEADGRRFARGSLIVHALRNDPAALDAFLADLLVAGLSAHRVETGLTDDGPVLAANANRVLVPPRVLLLRGEATSSNSYGQIWHLLDVAVPLPYTPVNADRLGRIDLDQYNVLVVPHLSGDLDAVAGKAALDTLDEWVRAGGAVVAVGSGASWASRRLLKLSEPTTTPDDKTKRPKASTLTWEERRERGVEDRIPGTSLRATIDGTHPLAAGLPEWIGVLKRGSRVLPVRDDGYVIARFDEEPHIGGLISRRNVERIGGEPFMTHHRHGRGVVICLSDDVTFRGYQQRPARLLLNAIVYGGSL